MLTPVEIESKSFKSVGLGYDKKDVDAYMREIVRSYEDTYRENMELKDKVAVLTEGIQHYKSIEKTLQKALMLAEKTAEDTRNAAQKEAKRIEKEATVKAGIMLADAKNELESLHQQTVQLVQQYEKYKAQFKSLATATVDMLNSDAFSINIQRLDAFISDPASFEIPSSGRKTAAQTEASSEEEIEFVPDPQSAGHLSDSDDDQNEFDFSDYDIDGQEEFDFVDLGDNE